MSVALELDRLKEVRRYEWAGSLIVVIVVTVPSVAYLSHWIGE